MSKLFFSSSATATATATARKTLYWLDLRASGLSMIERLSLEEALLRHDDRSWALVGTHDPIPHKYLSQQQQQQQPSSSPTVTVPSYIPNGDPNQINSDCMVIMGIGGKPDLLLNIPKVKEDGILVCKRFSGGGTVVLNASSLWTTFIGRKNDLPHVEAYPKSIMEWSADAVFGPTFQEMTQRTIAQQQSNNKTNNMTTNSKQKTLVMDSKSCSPTENLGRVVMIDKDKMSNSNHIDDESTATIPEFALRENDYVFGERKMAGNAQAIVSGGWLHHTSFLWDFEEEQMEYLKLPAKRPEYRGDRSHSEFLVKLQPYFGKDKNIFYKSLLHACQQSFQVEKVTLPQAMEVIDKKLGGMEAWWKVNRTKIQADF